MSMATQSIMVPAILWIVGLAVSVILLILGQIFLGVAVLHNARGHNNGSPGMWCALTVLFGGIPALIYLCTRNSAQNRLMICPQCQTTHPVGMANCPQCGVHNVYSDAFYSPYAEKERRSSKHFMIAWIILTALGVIGVVACAVVAFAFFEPYISYSSHPYYSYRHYW